MSVSAHVIALVSLYVFIWLAARIKIKDRMSEWIWQKLFLYFSYNANFNDNCFHVVFIYRHVNIDEFLLRHDFKARVRPNGLVCILLVSNQRRSSLFKKSLSFTIDTKCHPVSAFSSFCKLVTITMKLNVHNFSSYSTRLRRLAMTYTSKVRNSQKFTRSC